MSSAHHNTFHGTWLSIGTLMQRNFEHISFVIAQIFCCITISFSKLVLFLCCSCCYVAPKYVLYIYIYIYNPSHRFPYQHFSQTKIVQSYGQGIEPDPQLLKILYCLMGLYYKVKECTKIEVELQSIFVQIMHHWIHVN